MTDLLSQQLAQPSPSDADSIRCYGAELLVALNEDFLTTLKLHSAALPGSTEERMLARLASILGSCVRCLRDEGFTTAEFERAIARTIIDVTPRP